MVDLTDDDSAIGLERPIEEAFNAEEAIAPLLYLAPRVESILDDVFHEGSDKSDLGAAQKTSHAPMADIGDTGDMGDSIDEPAVQQSPDAENALEVQPALMRIQREMYRTDIRELQLAEARIGDIRVFRSRRESPWPTCPRVSLALLPKRFFPLCPCRSGFYACNSANSSSKTAYPLPQPLSIPAIAPVKHAISASVASSGTMASRTFVLPAKSVNVTVVNKTRGQSAIIGFVITFQSESVEE